MVIVPLPGVVAANTPVMPAGKPENVAPVTPLVVEYTMFVKVVLIQTACDVVAAAGESASRYQTDVQRCLSPITLRS